MAEINIDEHGVSDCFCNGSHWLVAYQGSNLTFFGQHKGEVTTKGTIDYYDTELEASERVVFLGLEDPLGLLS